MAVRLGSRAAADDLVEVHEINVTPFIDVMLVLLIIFMVAAPLATVDIAVNLPSSNAQPQQRPSKPVYLTLKADLSLALGDNPVARERLTGALDSALRLADVAGRGPLDDLQRAQLDVLLGRIAFAGNRGNDASPLMLNAASRLEHADLRLAHETYLDALIAALFAGRLAGDADAHVVARAARAAPRSGEVRASELLLDGLALLITDGWPSGTPTLKQAIDAF